AAAPKILDILLAAYTMARPACPCLRCATRACVVLVPHAPCVLGRQARWGALRLEPAWNPRPVVPALPSVEKDAVPPGSRAPEPPRGGRGPHGVPLGAARSRGSRLADSRGHHFAWCQRVCHSRYRGPAPARRGY